MRKRRREEAPLYKKDLLQPLADRPFQPPKISIEEAKLYKPARISTRCPQCGGELSFDEGSNAVQCSYCGVALLASGYGRILSYHLLPKMTDEDAQGDSLGLLASRGSKGTIRDIRLVFVPFYRLTGLDFSWSWRDKEITSPLTTPTPTADSSLRSFRKEEEGWDMGNLPPLKEKVYSLTWSYLDRTFLAAGLPFLNLRSLGVRSQILTLRLFDPSELSNRAQVMPVAMDWKKAWDRVEKTLTSENITRRKLINRILSLVFFPLWEVQIEGDGKTLSLIFDGVARSFLQEEATSPFLPEKSPDGTFSTQALRFRSLSCPNCGTTLPVEPAFRIFSCSTCHRVWQIREDEFEGIPYRLAISPGKPDISKTRYLPFWIFLGEVLLEGKIIANRLDLSRIIPMGRILSEEEKAMPLRFFIPAFKARDLSVVNRLSTSFTRMQPRFQTRERFEEVLYPGGVLDRNEAADFAHLALVSIAPKGNPKLVERVARAELSLSPGELIFFPFQEQLNSLREDFLGTAIQLNTLR